MATQEKSSLRIDFESAVEQIMDQEVRRQPLLPLYEAVHNAIHASMEMELDDIVIKVHIERSSNSLVDEVAPIESISVTDNGIGFREKELSSFFTIFTKNKRKKYNSKGIGRLAYFASFLNIEIASVFQDDDVYKERNFAVDVSSVDAKELPSAQLSDKKENKTTVTMRTLKKEFADKYKIHRDAIVSGLQDHFAAAMLSLDSLKIEVSDGDYFCTINKNSYLSCDINNIGIGRESFRIFYIKYRQDISKGNSIILTASGREVDQRAISFLSRNKIKRENEDNYYLKCYVVSEYLDKNVNASRTRFSGIPDRDGLENKPSLEGIYSEIGKGVRRYIAEVMPDIDDVNKQLIQKEVEDLPHLAAVLEDEEVINDIPLCSSREQIRSALVQAYSKKQVEALNYVKGKTKEYEKNGPPNFEEFLAKESEKLKEGAKLNHAHLTTYVMYREFIINLFKQFLKKQDDDKYAPESVLHNLIFPMRQSSNDWETDYYKHNLWLIDDRYAGYTYLASDLPEWKISESDYQPDDKRYDIIAAYEDPVTGAAQNIFLIELKKTHLPLGKDNDPVDQVSNYVFRIKEGKIDKADGGVINITDSTSYNAVILCDIHNPYFRKIMVDKHSLKPRSDGKSYFGFLQNGKLFVEVTNYENLLSIASLRNKAFMDKLKGH